MDKSENILYSKNVIEFVATANDYCTFLENADAFNLKEFVYETHKILPLLYSKATLLPEIETRMEEATEKFVTEGDYNMLHDSLLSKLGQYNDYQEVFDPLRQESEDPVSASIAEDLTDIYQDMKDFLMSYRISTNEIMNDAIWECHENFRNYWGQRLVNVIRALHNLQYGDAELEDQNGRQGHINEKNGNDIDTSSWFITKRQEDYRDENK